MAARRRRDRPRADNARLPTRKRVSKRNAFFRHVVKMPAAGVLTRLASKDITGGDLDMHILQRQGVADNAPSRELSRRGRADAARHPYYRQLAREILLALVCRCHRRRACVRCRAAVRHLAKRLGVTEVDVRVALLTIATE